MGNSQVEFSFIFVVVSVSFFNGLLTLLKLVSKTVPNPYIDEIFHIPQAQHYCENDFDQWDNKITTLPGLYLVSIAIIRPLEVALNLLLCSVYGLRFINALGTFFNFFLCYVIQQRLSPNQKDKGNYRDVMSALNMAAFPPLFFFSFLYYTDVWSTAFVLLMYYFHLSEYPLLAGLAGIGAVLMRQTNIVWVGFLLLDAGWTALVGKKKKYVDTFKDGLYKAQSALSQPFFFRVVQATAPYLIVCILFVSFVVINRGVVVGDRSAHQPVFHPMQNLYFLVAAAFFSLPHAIFEVGNIWKWRSRFPYLCTLWIGCALLSEYNFLQHPYLLADNRHLAFYIWKRVFGHETFRKLITPLYVFSVVALLSILKNQSKLFIAFIGLSTFLNLTPQYLFEIRYFIIPYLFLRLHYPNRKPAVLIETLYFTLINGAVFYIFLNKQFIWPSSPGEIQRIIW